MKSRLTASLVFAILISLVSCTKELSKENGVTTQLLNGDFYATINGTQWNADSLQSVFVSSIGVAISGLGKDGEQITMLLPTFKTGTYTVDSTSLSLANYSNIIVNTTAIFVSNFSIANGTINITIIDTVKHLVSGTFSYMLINPLDNSQKTITAGVFNSVPYTGSAGNGSIGGLADTLEASMGGVPFNAAQVVTSISNGELFLAGISADGNSDLTLAMPPDVTPGTYNMDFVTGMYFGGYDAGIVLLSQMNGTLTVISNDTVAKRISGTFSFIASPLTTGIPVTITNGYFSVSY
jgi:hypothetical protein